MRTANSQLSRQPVRRGDDLRPGNNQRCVFLKLVMQICDAVEMVALFVSLVIFPDAFMIQRHAKAANKAFSVQARYGAAEGIGEGIERHAGIGQLRLRRHGPAVIKIEALSCFQRKRIAKTVIAFSEFSVGRRKQIARQPRRMRLAIQIKSILEVPGQRAAYAHAGCLDRASACWRGNIGRPLAIMQRQPADQCGIFVFGQHALDAAAHHPSIGVDLRGRRGRFCPNMIARQIKAGPHRARIDSAAVPRNAASVPVALLNLAVAEAGPIAVSYPLLQSRQFIEIAHCLDISLIGWNCRREDRFALIIKDIGEVPVAPSRAILQAVAIGADNRAAGPEGPAVRSGRIAHIDNEYAFAFVPNAVSICIAELAGAAHACQNNIGRARRAGLRCVNSQNV